MHVGMSTYLLVTVGQLMRPCIGIEDCEGWWLSGCCRSVAEHWRLKPEVSWVQLPVTAGFFTFLYFRLITSKFIYFQREARCSEHLEWVNHSAWVLSWWREFSGRPLMEFWWHILGGCQVCDWGIQCHLCSTYRGLWGLVVVQLLWLSGRALAAQARGVLGSTPSDCRLFHFPLFSPHNI